MSAKPSSRKLAFSRAFAAMFAIAACVAWLSFVALRAKRNSVDVQGQLNCEHSAYGELREAAARGKEALRTALAQRFLTRSAPNVLVPLQQRYRRGRRLHARLQEALPPSARDWQPGEPLPWSGDLPPSELFALQRQIFLFELDWDSAPPGLIETALAFLAEWRRGNPDWPNRNPFAWNDDATANRLSAQIYLMEQARRLGASDLETERAFLVSLLQQARHLVREDEHNFQTNHGMMQNSALLSLSLHYPELDHGWEWRRLAIDRMRRHLEETVTADGVFLELTSDYHWWATLNTMWFVGACRHAGIEIDPIFEAQARKLLGFAGEILYPDGSLPVIADTRPAKKPYVPDWLWDAVPAWPEAVALREALASPDCPNAPGARLWPQSGYFLLRAPAPDWTAESGMMLTFKLHSRSRAHVHRDALSLTLFGRGSPLLVGPGYPAYDDSTVRRRLTGTVSQNTVAVDGGSQRVGTSEVLFDDVTLEGGIPRRVAIGARSSLYEGVDHERAVFYGAAEGAVLVVDRLSSAGEHTYAQQFRPADGLTTAAADGDALLTRADGRRALAIRSRLFADGEFTVPETVHSDGMIRFVHRGHDAWFVTLLDAGGVTTEPPVQAPDGSIVWRGPRGSLTLRGDGYEW